MGIWLGKYYNVLGSTRGCLLKDVKEEPVGNDFDRQGLTKSQGLAQPRLGGHNLGS